MRRAAVALALGGALAAHQFHYSRTEINWNTQAKTLEIIVTLHADDIQAKLREKHPGLELDRDPQAEPLVCAYTLDALRLQPLKPRCLGIKVGREFLDVFLEAPVAAPPASLTNTILTAELPDQRNDVELKKDGRLLGPRIQFNTSETRKPLRW